MTILKKNPFKKRSRSQRRNLRERKNPLIKTPEFRSSTIVPFWLLDNVDSLN
jgi:hypothetical protein